MSLFSTSIKSFPPSTLKLLLGVWGHLSTRRHLQLIALLVVMVVSGISESISLGAALPLLALLSDPKSLWNQSLIRNFANSLGFTEVRQLFLPITLIFVFAILFASSIRLLNLWLNGRLAAAIGSDLSSEAYKKTLYQPYLAHVQSNSSELITGITTQIDLTVLALNSLLQLITSACVANFLLIGLLIIDKSIALYSAFLFCSVYVIIAIITRKKLRFNGVKINQAFNLRLKALQEGLGAIRDVLLDGTQDVYLQNYMQADRPRRQLQADNVFLGLFPRFLLEGLGFVAIALLGCGLALQRGGNTLVIPILGTIALGAQRLLPALQQIYSSWSLIKSYNAAMQGVLDILNKPFSPTIDNVKPIKSFNILSFDQVYFKYNSDLPDVLRGLNLTIRRGERIGLIGSTGCGKSTTIDLLMGLLTPTSGCIKVNGENINDPSLPARLLSWRATISHVPQNIRKESLTYGKAVYFLHVHYKRD